MSQHILEYPFLSQPSWIFFKLNLTISLPNLGPGFVLVKTGAFLPSLVAPELNEKQLPYLQFQVRVQYLKKSLKSEVICSKILTACGIHCYTCDFHIMLIIPPHNSVRSCIHNCTAIPLTACAFIIVKDKTCSFPSPEPLVFYLRLIHGKEEVWGGR